MDESLIKICFAYAILARITRHYIKSKYPPNIEVNLPEGIKFLLTWVFIYIFTLVIISITQSIQILFNIF